jgi:hypothetical protein
MHHQAVISRIRSTCQDAATQPHGDASRPAGDHDPDQLA